jgi:hypothetical protein
VLSFSVALEALLFEVKTFDPIVAVVSGTLLMMATVAASDLPARRGALCESHCGPQSGLSPDCAHSAVRLRDAGSQGRTIYPSDRVNFGVTARHKD